MIWRANQVTGFCIVATFVFNELRFHNSSRNMFVNASEGIVFYFSNSVAETYLYRLKNSSNIGIKYLKAYFYEVDKFYANSLSASKAVSSRVIY